MGGRSPALALRAACGGDEGLDHLSGVSSESGDVGVVVLVGETAGDRCHREAEAVPVEALAGALDRLADEGGLEALTMRRIGKALGVEGMALYNHVANKDDILDGIVERVLAEIPLPAIGEEWKDQMRRRAIAARQVFLRHPWAIGLLEARHAGSSPARLGYYDAVLGCLRAAGFTPTLSMRACSIVLLAVSSPTR